MPMVLVDEATGSKYKAEHLTMGQSNVYALTPIPTTLTIGGIVWELVGKKRKVKRSEWYLNLNGLPELWFTEDESTYTYQVIRPLPRRRQPVPSDALHSIRKWHSFGVLVLEETGEVRKGKPEEWALSESKAYPLTVATFSEYPILRVVGIEGQV